MTPHDAVLFAQQAYLDPPTIGDPESASRAVITRTPEAVVVAFPGSNNIAAWLADLDFEIVTVPGLGDVHAGFWRAFREMAHGIIEVVGHDPVIFTGHSLGAALAILAGADFAFWSHSPLAIFGFEPPRVSIDDTLARLFVAKKVPVSLYKNGNDIVPDVPRIMHYWRHPADLINIGKATLHVPNIEDHNIVRVVNAVGA